MNSLKAWLLTALIFLGCLTVGAMLANVGTPSHPPQPIQPPPMGIGTVAR